MKPHASKLKTAGVELSRICEEAVRLERRLEQVRDSVLTVAAEETVPEASNRFPVREEVRAYRWTGQGLKTRPELATKVQSALGLDTKREAEVVIEAVVTAIERTLIENLNQNGFSLKLGGFGKFSVHHRPGTFRKIPFTGETKMTKAKRKVKFVALGRLRRLEDVADFGR
jgi:nucleoid DNA-binding protein